MGRLLGIFEKGIVGLIVLGCTSQPQPTGSPVPPSLPLPPSPTATASPTLPPTPTPNPNLHAGGLATVAVEALRRWADPQDKSSQRQLNRRYGLLEEGATVYLVDGPRHVDGVDYWQLWPSYWAGSSPLGWAPATDVSGAATLRPLEPRCPEYARPLTTDELWALEPLEHLACFGGSEIVVRGVVTCSRPIINGYIGGASYMRSNESCALGGVGVFGEAVFALLEEPQRVDEISGVYEVRGHFDDPAARGCHTIPMGVSLNIPGPPEPGAVQLCRQHFIVTSVAPLN